MEKKILLATAALSLLAAPCIQAAEINVFLDDGAHVPGSSNTNVPFSEHDRDVTWDVPASATNGLADIGAAVMSVRMVTFNVNGQSREAATASGNGLAVYTGANNNWMDGATREGALFQLTFYEDAAKTTEMTDLDIYFKSLTSRVQLGATDKQRIDVFSGSGALAVSGSGDAATVSLGGTTLIAGGEPAADKILRGLTPSADATDFYTMTSSDTGVIGDVPTFTENDSFWVRRRNDTSNDRAYQLGGITFNVIPEPATLGWLRFLVLAFCGFAAPSRYRSQRYPRVETRCLAVAVQSIPAELDGENLIPLLNGKRAGSGLCFGGFGIRPPFAKANGNTSTSPMGASASMIWKATGMKKTT